MKRFYQQLTDELDRHERLAVATVVTASGSTPRDAGAKMIVFPDGGIAFTVGGGVFESMVIQDALEVLRSGASVLKTYSFNPEGKFSTGAVCGGKVEILIEMITASAKLFIIGGGHVGQALIRAASTLDFAITLIDDRAEFARSSPDIKTVRSIHTPPDYSGIPEIASNTYICLVSKGYPADEAALRRVIQSPARYIGMIGSQKKIQTVFDNLAKDGFDRALFKKIHAPIGEPIFSESPEEIAISILAQIIRIKNQPHE